MTLQLLHGDCLELMKTLPDKSVDLFLCDLPYGCLTGGAGKEKARRMEKAPDGVMGGCDWDIKINLDLFWVQVERLMKDDHTPILHFCSTKFGVDLINSKQKWFRYDLVWNKMRGVSFLSANKMPMRSHEMVYVFSKKGANYYRTDIDDPTRPKRDDSNPKTNIGANTYNGGRPLPRPSVIYPAGKRCVLSVIEADNNANKKGKHPTQKPDDLYKWLIERYSKEGDCILDPTAGSFASCFTAKELNRNAIGMEMNDAFYNKAKSLVVE
jgi:site-specific DNA-methyltransferase (adenine-specific)